MPGAPGREVPGGGSVSAGAAAAFSSVTSTGEVTARLGAATQIRVGAVGPSSESGITFQNGEAGSNIYRSAAGVIRVDGAMIVAGASLSLFGDASAVVSIVAGTTNGLKIGTATSQKLGFFNATPVVQPTALTQTYSTADPTLATPTVVAPATTAASNVTPFGYTTAAQADAIRTGVTALIADVDDLRQFVNSAVDKLQALGLLS